MTGCLIVIAFLSISAVWVYIDADKLRRRYGRPIGGLSPVAWAVLTVPVWIIGFPAYIVTRLIVVNRIERAAQSAIPAAPASPLQTTRSGTASPAFCGQCGSPHPSDSQFCPSCGARL